MASRGRRGGASAREDEPRRDEQAEQQAPAPRGPVLPPPPPVDYGVFMQGLERTDVWWSSLLRTRFEDGAVDVTWDTFVRLFRAKFVPEHIQDKMVQEFLSLAQGSMTVLEYEGRFSELSNYAPHIVEDERRKTKKFLMGLKPSLRTRLVAFYHRTLDEALSSACRPAATFQWKDKKKTVYQTPQRSVTVSNSQVPFVRSPGVKKECPDCGKTHGGSECWLVAGRCLKCGSSDHKIKDYPRLQRGAPTPAVAAAAPATGRPGRPRAPARVFALAREDAEQAEHVTEGTVLLLGVHARVFFDTGATHSFIFEWFARQLALESGVESKELEAPLSVHTPVGTVSTRKCIPSLPVCIEDRILDGCFFLLKMKHYVAILDLDWLEEHYALVDCHRKKIVFRIPSEDEFSHPWPKNLAGKLVISAMKAMRMSSGRRPDWRQPLAVEVVSASRHGRQH
ncbi:hypothetical protein Taro_004787 [Colocasia esculenta]|uniref:Retrotransposon gag domain-containing protein n=1 Tax=Colocasia esculenta TaxID=4460 RepID=A0A843TQI6_COLES|nr:hypothetical protein [Colocasia esculenta]